MTTRTADEIRSAVSTAYGARARQVAETAASGAEQAATCCGESAPAGPKQVYYRPEEAGDLPESVVSYGCGNPTAIAGLRAGEVVLDLGSGAGLDCFLAARQVGPTGRVIGVDMTDEMLSLAEQNRAKLAVANVEFRKGMMEALPVEASSVDVIISNCVINLSPEKDAVFQEAFRVLRPGGRLHVADVVLTRQLAAAEQADLDLWAGCISGALLQDDYVARLRAAGFEAVLIDIAPLEGEAGVARSWRNALINARRPGGSATRRPWLSGAVERIELLAPAGLETAPCCDAGDPSDTRCC